MLVFLSFAYDTEKNNIYYTHLTESHNIWMMKNCWLKKKKKYYVRKSVGKKSIFVMEYLWCNSSFLY